MVEKRHTLIHIQYLVVLRCAIVWGTVHVLYQRVKVEKNYATRLQPANKFETTSFGDSKMNALLDIVEKWVCFEKIMNWFFALENTRAQWSTTRALLRHIWNFQPRRSKYWFSQYYPKQHWCWNWAQNVHSLWCTVKPVFNGHCPGRQANFAQPILGAPFTHFHHCFARSPPAIHI